MTLSPETLHRFEKTGTLLGYFGVHYLLSLVVTSLFFPLSQAYIAPLLEFVMPLSHASLPKTLLIMSLVFWLGASWSISQCWLKPIAVKQEL